MYKKIDAILNVNEMTSLLTGTIVRKLPRKLEVLEGENAVFCVEVENDDMEIHWFKDGFKLHETHQTILKSFGKTHILVFVNVAYQDSGVVTFVAGRSKTSSRLKVKGSKPANLFMIFGLSFNANVCSACSLDDFCKTTRNTCCPNQVFPLFALSLF